MDFNSADSWVAVENTSLGWARICMARDPVNSMNLAFWKQLHDALKACESAPDIRGVIFYSGLKRAVFSAGNDINELYAPATTRQRYKLFWRSSNKFLTDLYVSPLLTISAVRGACPAGGCCLSLCCDYRIMSDSGKIGLNEVELGIPVPKYWAALLARVTSQGVADKLCMFAQMLTPQQALSVGMLDEVVPASGLLRGADDAMASMLKLPDVGRIATKQQLRGSFSAEWEAYLEQEAEGAFTQLQQPETVDALKAILQRLSGGRSRM